MAGHDTPTTILACRDPRRTEWQLGPLPPGAGRMTIIGWHSDPPPDDAGVPADVAAVLARALTSVARATFLSSARADSRPGQVDLMSTRDAGTLLLAFDDAAWPWWMQGQVILLTTPAEAEPQFDRDDLLALLDDGWARGAAALAVSGVVGVVRPAVDGDLAGLLSLTPAFENATLAALEREARTAALAWAVVTEDEFATRL
jgi:hypothetical protein